MTMSARHITPARPPINMPYGDVWLAVSIGTSMGIQTGTNQFAFGISLLDSPESCYEHNSQEGGGRSPEQSSELALDGLDKPSEMVRYCL